MRPERAISLLCLVACADAERVPVALEEVRVSTHRELDPIVPPTGQSTSTNLQDLVCPPIERELEMTRVDPKTFDMRRKPSAPRSLEDLSRALRHRDLVSVRVDGEILRVTLAPDSDTTLFCLETGDFRVASFAPKEIVLERIRGNGIRRIRFLAFRDSEEEWRRFLAREVDVVPGANRSALRYLRDLPSVKLVPIPTTLPVGFRFQVARVPPDIRRAVSLAVHRKAVTRALGYDESTATTAPEDGEEAARLVAAHHVPPPFRVMTLRGEAEMRRAALVLEENLQRVGIPVSFEFLDIDAMFRRLKAGDFEAQLFFVGSADPTAWIVFRSDGPIDFYHYVNPEFNAAAQAGDVRRIREIIAQDVLEVPVFQVPDVIAVDARLCGIKPRQVDLSWLGDVHLCVPGETE